MPRLSYHSVPVTLLTLFLTACAVNPMDQLNQLNTLKQCCTALAELKVAGQLAPSQSAGTLTSSSDIILVQGGRTPAVTYVVPSEAVGRLVELRSYPDMGATKGGMQFAPVAGLFLNGMGEAVPATDDTGLKPMNGGLMYKFLVYRRITVPDGAKKLVVFSDPTKIGVREVMKHSTPSYLMPAGGIFVPIPGGDYVTSVWSVFGEYTLSLL